MSGSGASGTSGAGASKTSGSATKSGSGSSSSSSGTTNGVGRLEVGLLSGYAGLSGALVVSCFVGVGMVLLPVL